MTNDCAPAISSSMVFKLKYNVHPSCILLRLYSISSILILSFMANGMHGVAPMCQSSTKTCQVIKFVNSSMRRPKTEDRKVITKKRQTESTIFLPYNNNAQSSSLQWRTSLHKFQSLRMHCVFVSVCMCDRTRWQDSRSNSQSMYASKL